MSEKLPAGPMRDVLGKLSEATRGGEKLMVHVLCHRTGVPFAVMRDRLDEFVEKGWATKGIDAGVAVYGITPEGQELL